MRRYFPNVIIFGTMRAGTTSVFRYLSDHPAVFTSSKKELNIFFDYMQESDDVLGERYKDGFQGYSDRERILLDASPKYARKSWQVAERIRKLIPDAKIILFLRDPVERALSIFKARDRAEVLKPDVTFDEFVSALLAVPPDYRIFKNKADGEALQVEIAQVGKYSGILKDLLNWFESSHIYVGFLENLSTSPLKEMRAISDFLEIDASFYDGYKFSIENPAIVPRWPRLYYLALKTNARLEPFLNRFPLLRRQIRSLHHKLNNRKQNHGISDRTLALLNGFYREDKALLIAELKKLNIGSIPEWLR